MSVRASFVADFTSLERGFAKAEVQMRGFEQGLGRIDKDLNRFGNQFSGSKVISEALAMERVIRELGGTSKLTENELLRVGNTAREAAAKMKALGVDVPQRLQDLAKHAGGATKELTGLQAVIGKIGPALAATFSVGAVIGFAKEIGSFAGKMTDLSAETGVGVRRLQELNYAATGAGLTIEDITGSVTQLSRRLAGGDDSAAAAVERLGLNVYTLQQQKPDEAFLAISRAIAGIESPMERARTAMELFGRAGSRMLRLMTDDIDGLMEAARQSGAVIDEHLIKKADEFDDAMTQAILRVKAGFVNLFSGVIRGWEAVKESRERAIGAPNTLFGPNSAIGGAAGSAASLFRAWMNEDANDADIRWFAQRAARSGRSGVGFGDDRMPLGVGGALAVPTIPNDLAKIEKALEQSIKERITSNTRVEKAEEAYRRELNKFLQDDFREMAAATAKGGYFGAMTQYELAAANRMPLPLLSTRDRSREIAALSTGGLPGLGIFGGGSNNIGQVNALSPKGFFGSLFGDTGNSLMSSLKNTFKPSNLIGGVMTGGLNMLGDLAFKGIGKLFGKVFNSESKQTNRARDEALSAFGSQDDFRRMAAQAGVADAEIRKVFSTSKVKDFEAALAAVTKQIDASNAVLEKYGVTWEDLTGSRRTEGLGDAVKALTGELATLEKAGVSHESAILKVKDSYIELAAKAVAAGEEIPAALAPTLRDLALMGKLTEEDAQKLLGLASAGTVDFQRMEEVAKRYGIELSALGGKFQSAKIGAEAKSIIDDFNFLIENGADMAGVIAGMGDELQDVVKRGLEFGVALPEAMRPVLQRMVEQGRLTDAAGVKLEDLSKLNFAPPIEASIQKLIDKMGDLIDRIGDVGGAIAGLPAVPGVSVPASDPEAGDHTLTGHSTGTAGRYLNFGAGTPVMLHGRERVMTEAEGKAEAQASSSGDLAGLVLTLTALVRDLPNQTQAAMAIGRGRGWSRA